MPKNLEQLNLEIEKLTSQVEKLNSLLTEHIKTEIVLFKQILSVRKKDVKNLRAKDVKKTEAVKIKIDYNKMLKIIEALHAQDKLLNECFELITEIEKEIENDKIKKIEQLIEIIKGRNKFVEENILKAPIVK